MDTPRLVNSTQETVDLVAVVSEACDLICRSKIRQRHVFKAIRDELRRRSTSSVRVLYNACFGGFWLSPPFKAFAGLDGEESDDWSDRTTLIPIIKDYGRKVASDHPLLFSVIALMLHYESDVLNLDEVALMRRSYLPIFCCCHRLWARIYGS
jgi:hypothetical protein